MLWVPILGAILLWLPSPGSGQTQRGPGGVQSAAATVAVETPVVEAEVVRRTQRALSLSDVETVKYNGYLISPKPCTVDGLEGTCMFVWECIKSEGRHVGMCVDTFMFGSCCAHGPAANAVLPEHGAEPALLYTHHPHASDHNKHQQHSQQNYHHQHHQPQQQALPVSAFSTRPPHSVAVRPERPDASTSRPASNGLSFTYRPQHSVHATQPPRSTSGVYSRPTAASPLPNHNAIPSATKPAVTHWQFTTEPSFVTRVKTKPSSNSKPKPRPTKKPFHSTTSKSVNRNTVAVTAKPVPTTVRTTTTMAPATLSNVGASVSPDLMPTSTISSVSAAADTTGCGLPPLFPQPQTRIVGGKNAPFGRWPWQVSVRRTSFFGFSSTHRCGGAVLNENWIATAGHCVDDLLTSQIRIRVGEYDFSSVQEELPYVERGVAKKLVHPKYNFFTYEYDLALVKLDKPLEFAPHISPICLPASDDLLIGENATVTGWGRLSEKGTLPSVLQEVSVPIVSNDRCKNMFLRAGRHEFIPEIFLCAGHEHGGQDSCQGDSGGPLQVRGKDGRYFLAGIISWGIGCAEANLPGVCTRVSKFVPWILKNVT